MAMNRRRFIISSGAVLLIGAKAGIAKAAAGEPRYLCVIEESVIFLGVSPIGRSGDTCLRTLQQAVDLAVDSKKPLKLGPGEYSASSLIISSPITMHGVPGEVTMRTTGTGLRLDIRHAAQGAAGRSLDIQNVAFSS